MKFHEEVLNKAQKKVLGRLGPLMKEKGFYLGGGTAIALYLGHRRSKDFDWFTASPFKDPLKLAQTFKEEGISLKVTQVARGTLDGIISGVGVSFFEYRYPLLKTTTRWPEMNTSLASLPDLACMKLSAIVQRGSKKDFIDIFALEEKKFPLKKMLSYYQKKFGLKDIGNILYALSYFDDADKERMPNMLWKTDWNTIKRTVKDRLKDEMN
jgi:hypothetical protein